SVDALRASTPEAASAQIGLARFLLDKSRPVDSAAVIRLSDPTALLRESETAQYINALISAGHWSVARDIWRHLMKRTPEEDASIVWNGSFESDILLDFGQFDWSFEQNSYAVIAIDNGMAHSGKRSLKVDFLGHETTRLQKEIKQTIVVQPGARYRVE